MSDACLPCEFNWILLGVLIQAIRDATAGLDAHTAAAAYLIANVPGTASSRNPLEFGTREDKGIVLETSRNLVTRFS